MTAETEIRVRYVECDPMGVAHHTSYPVWFEMGRTELLRSSGTDYAALERDGVFLAVVSLDVRYLKPARYDDVLTLHTSLASCGRVKVEHHYVLRRGGDTLSTGRTVLACLDANGQLRAVPDMIRGDASEA
ncbi:MAG: thioesterase family protein [Phycisphaerales bacterium]|jgi:acyl-CoA thioester hydrolase|nr:thioesterase family protein [Phycisphaerales bacterium]